MRRACTTGQLYMRLCLDKQDSMAVCVGVHSFLSVLIPTHSPASTEVALIGTRYPSLSLSSLTCALCRKTEGYSCSDLTSLAREAAFGPIRGSPSHWLMSSCAYCVCAQSVHVCACVCMCVHVCVRERRDCACVCMHVTVHVVLGCCVNTCRSEHVTSQRLP